MTRQVEAEPRNDEAADSAQPTIPSPVIRARAVGRPTAQPMRWSWKLGEISGIGVYVHGTFLILLAWVALLHFWQGDTLLLALEGMLFVIAIFTVVVLHELGHALTAQRFGIRTRDITLLPIGGVARLERMPEDPKQELLVALAGPAVNVVLAAVLAVLLFSVAELSPVTNLVLVGGGPWQFVAKLMWVNLTLAGFNMLPAFPMDGGRVLRALLALRMDYGRATRIAATLGQGLAFVFGFIGLFSNPLLVLIALFVWMGASAEVSAVQSRPNGIPLSRATITDIRSGAPDETMSQAADHVLAGFQSETRSKQVD